MRILITVLISAICFGQDIKVKINKSTKVILKNDRTWNLDKKVEIKTKDGKVAIIHPDNNWEYKDTFDKISVQQIDDDIQKCFYLVEPMGGIKRILKCSHQLIVHIVATS